MHYNSSFSNHNFIRVRKSGEHFQLNQEFDAEVKVRPWSKYAFYVTASNSLGSSQPSGPTGKECNTLQVAPYRNPSGVCGSLKSPSQLVIVWEVGCSLLLSLDMFQSEILSSWGRNIEIFYIVTTYDLDFTCAILHHRSSDWTDIKPIKVPVQGEC